MRLTILAALAALLTLVGCGGAPGYPPSHRSLPQPATPCQQGTMGCAVPPAKPGVGAPRVGHQTLIPDVSEYQACALHSEAIFRVYEAGTGREDSTAVCHARELQRLHAWAGVYAFLRPGDCATEARRTVQIVKSLPVEVQAIVADAEVSLNAGCVLRFMAVVKSLGYPAVEYTCPGCGVEHVEPIWVAAYPYRPAGRWVAHQFSDNYNCRGVTGDCSVDEGILLIRRVDRAALIARRRALRRVLAAYGCRRRVRVHERLGPRCRRWRNEGAAVNRALS